MEMANLAGFSQAGIPVIIRGSTAMPMQDTTSAAVMMMLVAVSGALSLQAQRSSIARRLETNGCSFSVLTMSTFYADCVDVALSGPSWRGLVSSFLQKTGTVGSRASVPKNQNISV